MAALAALVSVACVVASPSTVTTLPVLGVLDVGATRSRAAVSPSTLLLSLVPEIEAALVPSMTPPPPLVLAMRAELLSFLASRLSGLVVVVGGSTGRVRVDAGGGVIIARACSSLISPADTMFARSGVSIWLVAVTEAVAPAFAASMSPPPDPLPVLPVRLPAVAIVDKDLGAGPVVVAMGRGGGVNILRACSSEIAPVATISLRSGVRGAAAIEGSVRGDVGPVISFLPQTWNAGSDERLRRREDKLKPSSITTNKGAHFRAYIFSGSDSQ